MLECGRLSNGCAAEFVAGVLILYFCKAERLKMLDHSVCLATDAVYAVFPALDLAVLAGLLIAGGEGNIMLPARCSSAAIVVFAGTNVAKPCWSCWNAMLAAVVWICGISADERMSPCDDEASAGLVRTDAVAATPGF
ncbi:hypothetical protein Nepgr_031333 [Nepenthes gracilis]|uniref:Uncharacterized protein n=1 Tax=Nepenthes gracilis TaxID=150966 RepID=A0AAD3Y6Q5_NEPGR|nr:hypothetical protein Nepgr_031333 [Nepenthes gracilis]